MGFAERTRKNWLFAGNDKAGQTAATLYSLIASAERHDADPQRYLTIVLAKIATATAGEMELLLPDAWKKGDQAEPRVTATVAPGGADPSLRA